MQRIGRVDRRMNPKIENLIKAKHPEEKKLRKKIWFWNFLPPGELDDILRLYNRVAHKVLRISETTGLEGEKLLTPDDHYNTLRNFNEAYEGAPSTEENLRLYLTKALKSDQQLEEFLETMPGRVFSAKETTGRISGLFACYRLPYIGQESKDNNLGEFRWYFLPDGSKDIITSVEQINHFISANQNTKRINGRPIEERSDRLKLIERYIKNRELRVRKAATMAQVVGGKDAANRLKLVAWMDVL
jgi:hypothetical protein